MNEMEGLREALKQKERELDGYKRELKALQISVESQKDRILAGSLIEIVDRFARSTKDRLEHGGASHRMYSSGSFPFIPSDSRRASEMLFEMFSAKVPERFLDCGCGIGNIILLANGIAYGINSRIHGHFGGFAAQGIEFDEETIKTARSLWIDHCIIRGDLLKFDKYADYDFIYFYCPLSRPEKEVEFETRMLTQIKPGTRITAMLSRFEVYTEYVEGSPGVRRIVPSGNRSKRGDFYIDAEAICEQFEWADKDALLKLRLKEIRSASHSNIIGYEKIS